jgi:N-acetylglutamate synthase-like GNAT family acetyltransferase
MPVFDLSNVIVRSTMRSSGRFTALMDLIEDQVPKYGFKAIYIESVLEPRLESFISRRGYTRTPDPHPYCYFKMV